MPMSLFLKVILILALCKKTSEDFFNYFIRKYQSTLSSPHKNVCAGYDALAVFLESDSLSSLPLHIPDNSLAPSQPYPMWLQTGLACM